MLSFKSFIVLGLIFSSSIYLNFYIWCEVEVHIHFFAYVYPVASLVSSLNSLLKTLFSLLNCLITNQLLINIKSLFLDCPFYSIDLRIWPMPVSYCLDFSYFLLSFETKKYEYFVCFSRLF